MTLLEELKRASSTSEQFSPADHLYDRAAKEIEELRRQNAELQQHNEALKQVVPMELVELKKQNAELRECLKAIEWVNGDYGTSMQNMVSCPVCGIIHDKFTKDMKHHKFCKLGKALAAQPEGDAK